MSADEGHANKTGVTPAKPTVFLAYPFGERDKWIRNCILPLLRAWGCQVETGDKHWAKGISVAVGNQIANSRLLVAFLTQHQQLANKKRWVPSEWVLQEIGFALGKGIPVLLIREQDLETKIGIAGDIQFIELDAYHPFQACTELREAIRDLLFDGLDDGSVALYHLTKPTDEVTKGKQWYDFWLWIDGSEGCLEQISEVSYEIEADSKSYVDPAEKRPTFDTYAMTNDSVSITATISFIDEKKPKKVVHHTVRVPGSGMTKVQ